MEHEQILVRRGSRSGLPVIVAVHSTALGQAIGGCRMQHYPGWRDGLTDVLRLSAAMTAKCALAGLPNGGGKTVVALPFPSSALSFEQRRDVLHDVGDTIEALGGAYATGPDVGTGPDDMVTIGERTGNVFCKPSSAGGSGDSSPATAVGTVAALSALSDFRGRRFAVLGLGRVGARVATLLAEAGAELTVADVDPARRELASSLGATWVSPQECLTAEVDVLVPAALGGLLTPSTVPMLRCAAVAGPANNQLDEPATASLLHERGILWAPDIVVSAGGILHATAVELHGETEEQAMDRVRGIGTTLATILDTAKAEGIIPAEAANRLATARTRRA